MATAWTFQRTPATHISPVKRDGRWSLAMIARDEEATIGQVLDDASAICDELVVVDTGSIDSTRAVAESHGAKVLDFEWVDDFAAARNFSFASCSSEWILWLDADDRLPAEAIDGFVRLKSELSAKDWVKAVSVPYRYQFSATDPSVCVVSHRVVRVVRRGFGLAWQGRIHEQLPVSPGRLLVHDGAFVDHRPTAGHGQRSVERNIRIVQACIAAGDSSPRMLRLLAGELRCAERFEEAASALEQYLKVAGTSPASRLFRYEALVDLAVCSQMLGYEEDCYRLLLDAVELDGTRADALFRLGVHHFAREEWEAAAHYFQVVTSLDAPKDGLVYEEAYSWWAWDYLAICHGELGLYRQALEETDIALAESTDPARLLARRRLYLERLSAGESEPASSL